MNNTVKVLVALTMLVALSHLYDVTTQREQQAMVGHNVYRIYM